MKRVIVVGIIFTLIMPAIATNEINSFRLNGNGRILYVGGSGPNNYTSIQDAINNASDGYTIYVYYGNYNESIIINKSISLIGIDKTENKPVVNGGNSTAIHILSDNCLVEYLKIISKSDKTIEISSSFISIENCNIKNCQQRIDGGIWYGEGVDLRNSRNTKIAHSEIYEVGYGLFIYNCSGCVIHNNTFYDTHLTAIYAREFDGSNISNNTVNGGFYGSLWLIVCSNNSIFGNIFNGGMELDDCSYNEFYENHLSGIRIYSSDKELFMDNYMNSVKLIHSTNLIIKNNTFSNGSSISFWNSNDVQYYNTHTIENNKRIDGEPILYYKNQMNTAISGDAAEIILVNCTSCRVEHASIINSSTGIFVAHSMDTVISNCSLYYYRTDMGHAIEVEYCNHCAILNNNISTFLAGIFVSASERPKIIGNYVQKTRWAIACSSSYAIIKNNILSENTEGILVSGGKLNVISRNDIINNFDGVDLEKTFGNIIWGNNFIGNSQDTIVYESFVNIFFRNYWSNWRIPFPKPILCILVSIPWVIVIYYLKFDWCPRVFPYRG